MALESQSSDLAERPRKRRRPPFSCVQCRQRKIKCDRTNPCGPCTRSKNSRCVYRSDTVMSNIKSNSSLPVLNHSSSQSARHTEYPQSIITPESTPGAPNGVGVMKSVDASLPMSPYSTLEPATSRINQASGAVETMPTVIQRLVSSSGEQQNSEIEKPIRGTLSKTRLFGPSHWMNSIEAFRTGSFPATKSDNFAIAPPHPLYHTSNEIRTLLDNCKALARSIKIRDHKELETDSNLRDLIPSRELSDQLVDLYLDNFESSYRILHIPSFRKEYNQFWLQNYTTGFLYKFLLVLSIGSSLYQGSDAPKLHRKVLQWIYAAQKWLVGPFEKSRLNVNGLQVQCLIILARQANSVGGDLTFVALGSLVRTSMIMGFHRDPKHFPKVSVLQTEIRRRLWATILEMTLHSTLDSGMQPLLKEEDFDTEPPSNLDDDDFDEMTLVKEPKPITIYTQTSLQILLRKSFHARNRVLTLINSISSEPSYDEVIHLDKELEGVYRMVASTMEKYRTATISNIDFQARGPNAFQRNLHSHMSRRFILALHRIFAIKDNVDGRYYFSRKICLEVALSMVYPEPDSHYARLCLVGGGMFRDVLMFASFTIYWDLLAQIENDKSQSMLVRHAANRESAREALLKLKAISEQRVMLYENNVKGYVFLCIAISQIDAIESGASVELEILRGGTQGMRYALNLLKERSELSMATDHQQIHNIDRPICNLTAGILNRVDCMNVPENVLEDDFQDFGLNILAEDLNFGLENPAAWFLSGWDEPNFVQ